MTIELPVAIVGTTNSAAKSCGKYILERELASGGMGTIWVARDPQLRRRVALKRLRPDGQSSSPGLERFERFEREAQAIALLQSPHVVQVFDYGVDDDGAPFIVMELLDGHDLAHALERRPCWSPASFSSVLSQVAKALSLAHAAGIVHRDLKPGNIFLARSGSEEIIKVLDFGIAAVRADSAPGWESKPWTLSGTPSYMSPEQMRGRSFDARSDLWSLGVVAYQALTGKLPFSGTSLHDLMFAILADPIARPSSLVPALGSRVDQFFVRALAREAGDRFRSAREMAAAFAALGEGAAERRVARILVVDDEPDVSRLIRQRFRKKVRDSEYELLFAADGEAALEHLRHNPDIDVVLSDIQMPRMDGLTFLTHATETSPLTKIIMISAYGDMPNIRQAMNSGAFDFLVKPMNLDDLEATVEKAFQHTTELRTAVGHFEENSILRMFVHRGIVERLLPAIRRAGVPAGEAMAATVIAIRISGLAQAASEQPPDDVLDALNAGFEAILPEIVARGGTVDRFVGDVLVAAFHGDGHVLSAVDACLSAREEMRRRAGTPGLVPFGSGVAIGVESGRVIVGTVGSRSLSRLDYALIGQVVSAAVDLAGVAGENQILLGAAARSAAGGVYELTAVDEAASPASHRSAVHRVEARIGELRTPESLQPTVLLRRDETTQ